MMNSIYRIEQLNGRREKYLSKIESVFLNYSKVHFNSLYELEKVEYDTLNGYLLH